MSSLLYRAYNRVFRPYEIWNIGIVNAPISVFLEPDVRPKVHWLQTIGDEKYLADPFALVRDQRTYIFSEEFDYHTNKGRIVHIDVRDDNSYESRPAIELPSHVSHPYLFEDEGEIYCIPETHQAREIGLYRAKRFPLEWAKVSTLVDEVGGLDSTIFKFEDRWWLMFCDKDFNSLDGLFVWHAPGLMGPWLPHASNPVKKNIHCCRPAGTPFIHNGRLYRPAQDCSRTYGGRITINQVTKLTPTEFKEEPKIFIEPYAESEYPHGIHTLSSAGNVTLLDGKRLTFLNGAFRESLMRNLTRFRFRG